MEDLLVAVQELSKEWGIDESELLRIAKQKEFINEEYLQEIQKLQGGNKCSNSCYYFKWCFKIVFAAIALFYIYYYIYYCAELDAAEKANTVPETYATRELAYEEGEFLSEYFTYQAVYEVCKTPTDTIRRWGISVNELRLTPINFILVSLFFVSTVPKCMYSMISYCCRNNTFNFTDLASYLIGFHNEKQPLLISPSSEEISNVATTNVALPNVATNVQRRSRASSVASRTRRGRKQSDLGGGEVNITEALTKEEEDFFQELFQARAAEIWATVYDEEKQSLRTTASIEQLEGGAGDSFKKYTTYICQIVYIMVLVQFITLLQFFITSPIFLTKDNISNETYYNMNVSTQVTMPDYYLQYDFNLDTPIYVNRLTNQTETLPYLFTSEFTKKFYQNIKDENFNLDQLIRKEDSRNLFKNLLPETPIQVTLENGAILQKDYRSLWSKLYNQLPSSSFIARYLDEYNLNIIADTFFNENFQQQKLQETIDSARILKEKINRLNISVLQDNMTTICEENTGLFEMLSNWFTDQPKDCAEFKPLLQNLTDTFALGYREIRFLGDMEKKLYEIVFATKTGTELKQDLVIYGTRLSNISVIPFNQYSLALPEFLEPFFIPGIGVIRIPKSEFPTLQKTLFIGGKQSLKVALDQIANNVTSQIQDIQAKKLGKQINKQVNDATENLIQLCLKYAGLAVGGYYLVKSIYRGLGVPFRALGRAATILSSITDSYQVNEFFQSCKTGPLRACEAVTVLTMKSVTLFSVPVLIPLDYYGFEIGKNIPGSYWGIMIIYMYPFFKNFLPSLSSVSQLKKLIYIVLGFYLILALATLNAEQRALYLADPVSYRFSYKNSLILNNFAKEATSLYDYVNELPSAIPSSNVTLEFPSQQQGNVTVTPSLTIVPSSTSSPVFIPTLITTPNASPSVSRTSSINPSFNISNVPYNVSNVASSNELVPYNVSNLAIEEKINQEIIGKNASELYELVNEIAREKISGSWRFPTNRDVYEFFKSVDRFTNENINDPWNKFWNDYFYEE